MIIDKNLFSNRSGLQKVYRVQVENIGNVSEVYLSNFFSKAGPIKHIQHSGSMAIITYENPKYVEKAMKFNGRILGNTKPLKITSLNNKKKEDQKQEKIPYNSTNNRDKLLSTWEKSRQFSQKPQKKISKQDQKIKQQHQFEFEVSNFLATISELSQRVTKQTEKSIKSLAVFELIVIQAILKLKFRNLLHLYAFDINPETDSILSRLINLLVSRDEFMVDTWDKVILLGVNLYPSLHFSEQQSKLLCDNANAENNVKKIMKKYDLLNLYLQLDTYQKIKNEGVNLETENLGWIIKQTYKAQWGFTRKTYLPGQLQQQPQSIFSESKLQLTKRQFSGYGPKNIPFKAIFNEYADNIVPNLFLIHNQQKRKQLKTQQLPFVKILGCNIALNLEKDQIFILQENQFSNYYLYTAQNHTKGIIKKTVNQIKMNQYVVIFDCEEHANPNDIRLFLNVFQQVHKASKYTMIFLLTNEDSGHPDSNIQNILEMLNIRQVYLLVVTNDSAFNRRCCQKFIEDYIDKIKEEQQLSQTTQYDLKALAKKVINQNMEYFQPQIQNITIRKTQKTQPSQHFESVSIENSRIQHQMKMQKLQSKVHSMMEQAYKCSHQRRMRTKFKNIIKSIRNQNEKKFNQRQQPIRQNKRPRISDYSDSGRSEKSWDRSR